MNNTIAIFPICLIQPVFFFLNLSSDILVQNVCYQIDKILLIHLINSNRDESKNKVIFKELLK